MSRRLLDYNPETQGAEGDLLIFGVPTQRSSTRSPGELEELEFANTFLESASPQQLGTVIERLLRRGAARIGRTIDPQVAQLLGPRLMRAGQSVRTLLRPPVGRPISSDSSEVMERITGAELEGLSAEDQEFETARAFVRFALEAGRTAARAAAMQIPAAVAAAALRIAAQRHAPGLALIQPPPQRFRVRRAIRRQSLV